MTYHALVYPATLPGPKTASISSTERRLLAPQGGPLDTRAAQRDRHAQQEITFPPFTAAERAIFQAWWKDTLTFGGAWFAATWPLPQGIVSGVRRFVGAPKWSFIEGGFFQVSASFEVRGVGLPPAAFFSEIWISSALYPLLAIESYGATSGLAKGYYVTPESHQYSMTSALVSGTLSSTLRTYTLWPFEQYSLTSALVSGTLDTVLRTYTLWPFEQYSMTSTLVSGTLDTVLRTYTNWPFEQYSMTSALTGGTLG